MKVLDIIHEEHNINIIVELDSQVWQNKIKPLIQQAMKKVKIDGFRVGNAPASLASKYINRGEIYEKAANKLIDSILLEIEKDERVVKDETEIIDKPMINFKDVDDEKCVLSFVYEVTPNVELPDYSKIKFENIKELVASEQEIEQEIEKILKNSQNKNESKELDNELVKTFKIKDVETVKQFKEWIKSKIIEGKEYDNRDVAGKQIASFLIENTKIDYIPNSYLNENLDAQRNELANKLTRSKMSLNDYLKASNLTQKDLFEQFKKNAQNAVIVSLAFEKIIENEKIVVSEKEINEYIEKLSTLYGIENDELKKTMNDSQLNTIKVSILNNSVIDKLIKMNKN